MTTSIPRIRHWAGILGLVALSAAIGLGLAEAAVRVFNVGPHILALNHGNFRLSHDPILRYELAPGSPDGKTVISRDGLRDREFSLAKPPGTFRIACIGDSITFGFGLDAADSYPKRLEHLLNAYGATSNRHFEVLNFGVPGYNLREIAENLQTRVLKFQPDLVLYGYCLNDPQGVSLEFMNLLANLTSAGQKFVCPPPADGFLVKHSRLWRLAVYTLRRSTTQGRTMGNGKVNATADPENIAIQKSAEVPYFTDLYASPEGRQTLETSLDAIASACAAQQVPVYVFVFPLMDHLEAYPLAALHQQVAQLCRARSFHVYDLTDDFRDFQHHLRSKEYLDAIHPAEPTDCFTAFVMLSHLLQDSMLPHVTDDEVTRRLHAGTQDDQRFGRLAHLLPAS